MNHSFIVTKIYKVAGRRNRLAAASLVRLKL
jgi:hypothetical protein